MRLGYIYAIKTMYTCDKICTYMYRAKRKALNLQQKMYGICERFV